MERSFKNIGQYKDLLSPVVDGSKEIVCFNCQKSLSPLQIVSEGRRIPDIYICPNCFAPNVFGEDGEPLLQSLYGQELKGLPEDIESVYNEMRNCFSIGAFTSVVMLARILIMRACVESGAGKGWGFAEYVEWLEKKDHLPKQIGDGLSEVRKLGNEANHEINTRSKEEAKFSIDFMGKFLSSFY